jgi:hypothetical protein
MKASESSSHSRTLSTSRPPVIYEEAIIEGVRMLVIIGKDVDTGHPVRPRRQRRNAADLQSSRDG